MELDTKSLEESQEKSQGPLEKIPCTGEVEPTEEPVQLEKIAEGSQNGPVALVEIRQETHETFQEGFLEEIQTPRGIAGCLIGFLASVAAIFGVYRGTSHITPLGNDEAPTSNPEPKPLSSAKSAKLAPSAESSNNGLETPSILKQILDYIRSVVREFFRRLLHGTPYQLA